VSFGLQQWPHTDDKPVTKQITYRNTGTEPVTLDLSLETTGPQGKPAPAGFFTTDTNRVTVPASGTATVALTSDTGTGSLDGAYSGALVAKATDGGQRVRTTFGAIREVESYDLTMKFIDADGKPTAAVADVTGHEGIFESMAAGVGSAKVRVPKGTYLVEVPIETMETDGGTPNIALMTQTGLSVTKNETVTFDARTAKPVSITAPDSAKLSRAYITTDLHTPGIEPQWSAYNLDTFKGLSTAQVGPAVPANLFDVHISGMWQKGSTGYNLVYSRSGSMFTGFSHQTAKRPPATSGRWFRRGSWRMSSTLPTAPAFGSVVPNTTRGTRASTMAPAHIAHGSSVT